jgi:hypothetical protein
MIRKFLLTLLFLPFLIHPSFSQVNVRDSAIVIPMIYATYAYQVPGGDLAKRFYGNSSIGGGFIVKMKTGWIILGEGNYIFGSNIKNSDSLLKNISTPDGWVINANGYYAEIGYGETGFNVMGKFGKLFPVLSPNPNSGPVIMAGIGFMQTKIRIHDGDNTAPQIYGDYKKGYDRLNNGVAVSGDVGYMFLSDSRIINFFVGFEFMQTWTKYRRERDFDTEKHDASSLSTQYYGVKVKWFIPLYKRKPKEFYLY